MVTHTAGNYTISFEGVEANPNSVALIDAVTLNDVLVANGSFETPVLTGTEFERYNPPNAVWTFAGGTGVSGNGSGFTSGNPNAPEGGQVSFVQFDGVISQAVSLNGGVYTLSFEAAQRGNYQRGVTGSVGSYGVGP